MQGVIKSLFHYATISSSLCTFSIPSITSETGIALASFKTKEKEKNARTSKTETVK